LTTLPASADVQPVLSQAKKRSSLLPLLTVLFLISYAMMTLLITFQSTTIQSQRSLIVQLLSDSTQLWALKGKALREKQTQTQNHAQAPSSQAQAPSAQAPSTQAVPQHKKQQTEKNSKPQIQLPPVPAADLGDHRRVLITI
jgi:hypothetical protein